MAKNAKQMSNEFDSDDVKKYVKQIEDCFDEIASSQGQHMNRCRQIRESITNAYELAKKAGIPKKELKAYITGRQRLAAARRVLVGLEPDEKETVEMLAAAMGDAADLPLFKHALDDAAKSAGLDVLRAN